MDPPDAGSTDGKSLKASLLPCRDTPCPLSQRSEPWLPFPQGFGTIDGLSRMRLELLKCNQPWLRRCLAPPRLPERLLLLVGFFFSPSGGILWLPSQNLRPQSHGPRPPASTLSCAADSSLLVS
ncbi:uncharacterized protein ACIBXB_011823 [Morphnus guianensis]